MLEKLQNAPRATRQKWFVAITIVVVIIVVILWVRYVSWSFHAAANSGRPGELQQGFGPAQSLKGVLGGFYDAIRSTKQ
jgi:heme/copper-type cytochrome/quinol oxidase subunit 2